MDGLTVAQLYERKKDCRGVVSSDGGADYPLKLPVLVLARTYQPVRIATVRRAIQLLYSNVARALDDGGELCDFVRWARLPVRDGIDDELLMVSGKLRVPRVVYLGRFVQVRRPSVRLTRRNIMLRDGFCCQYCGERRPASQLDMDHVMPRSRGGERSWQNLVTACTACNRRKRNRTPQEARMPLLSRPVMPRWSSSARLLMGISGHYKEWEPFLCAG